SKCATAHSLRNLNRGEGAALDAPLFEEVIDWTDPITIEFNLEASQRGQKREKTGLGTLYIARQIPDSLGEPATTIGDNERDVDAKIITVG
ncbi:hypothetical protein BD769DRAFT_1298379, partial [Suillus cothurnatus]